MPRRHKHLPRVFGVQLSNMGRTAVRWGMARNNSAVVLTFFAPHITAAALSVHVDVDDDAQHWLHVVADNPPLLDVHLGLYNAARLCDEHPPRILPRGELRVVLVPQHPDDQLVAPWPRLTRCTHAEAPVTVSTDWDLYSDDDA